MPRLTFVVVISAFFISPVICYAQWIPNGVPLRPDAGQQYLPSIASDGAGGAIVAWQDFRSGVNFDIYAQRISNAGVVQWANAGAALSTADNNREGLRDGRRQNMIADGAGGAIVTWHDYRNGDADIYAQRVTGSGTVLWTTDGVLLSAAHGEKIYPAIIPDGAGGAIVTWEDYRNLPRGDTYAQRVSASGTVLWAADGVALCPPGGRIVSDDAGGALVTWTEALNDDDYDVYAQHVNGAGIAQWTQRGVPLSEGVGKQYATTIVSDGAGGAIVTWGDDRNPDGDIYAQRINGDGTVQWATDGVLFVTASHALSHVCISDLDGGAITVWQDFRGTHSSELRAQRITASGAVSWPEGGVKVCHAQGDQYDPHIASDGASGVIITWDDYREGNSNIDLYAQRVSAGGTILWPTKGVAVSVAQYAQVGPMIISDGGGGAIVTWYEDRIGGPFVYAQRIGADGRTTDATPPQVTVNLSRDMLWPPNNKLASVCATVEVADNLDPEPTFTLLSITAIDGKRRVDTAEDIKNATTGTADLCYELRAARSGTGDGRVYRIIYEAKDASNNVAYDTVSVRVPASAPRLTESQAECVTVLSSVHPNPFNPETTVEYSLQSTERVVIGVYDVRGSLVRRLVDQSMSAGEHRVTWNGVDDAGRSASSGIYFVRMTAGSYTESGKIVMLK
jgi:hypothetical protein